MLWIQWTALGQALRGKLDPCRVPRGWGRSSGLDGEGEGHSGSSGDACGLDGEARLTLSPCSQQTFSELLPPSMRGLMGSPSIREKPP